MNGVDGRHISGCWGADSGEAAWFCAAGPVCASGGRDPVWRGGGEHQHYYDLLRVSSCRFYSGQPTMKDME
jgi:hypothetical protein